ncbi:hypothetical protein QJQ45_025947 [Haematococcus lacustris]|nr:hypothetical protein QJQ45_025947 [Haematococcus lacustris]
MAAIRQQKYNGKNTDTSVVMLKVQARKFTATWAFEFVEGIAKAFCKRCPLPEDPDSSIEDRDEALQPDLTEAQRNRKVSGEARAARDRDNTYHGRKCKIAHLIDHLPQELRDAFLDDAVQPRVEAISERAVLASLLFGLLTSQFPRQPYLQLIKQAKQRWPDRIVALAYGAAGFSGSGSLGCRGVPVSQMRKEAVRQFGAGRVVLVDEFRTSRVSSAYSHPSEALPGQPPESFRWLRPVYSKAKRSQVRGLMCSTSNNIRFYDRDVSAALNIRRCAVGPGPRPTELCYWDGRPAMPKPGRPGQEWVYLRDKALLRVEEERDVTHDAYMLAFEAAKPSAMRVPGLQEFAAALWARRRYSTSGDPLHHLFKEYDADNDGKLKADEIAAAFASHSVSISAEQVKALIATYVIDSETCDTDPDSAPATDTISAQMWPEWIHSLAISELHSRGGASRSCSSSDSD